MRFSAAPSSATQRRGARAARGQAAHTCEVRHGFAVLQPAAQRRVPAKGLRHDAKAGIVAQTQLRTQAMSNAHATHPRAPQSAWRTKLAIWRQTSPAVES